MDLEIASCISKYYNQFFNEKEAKAHRYLNSIIKLKGESEDSSRYRVYKRKCWITDDKEALDLIKNGEEDFFIKTANRILKEHNDDVFLNNCPKCQKLARTPIARQCRYCGNKWFE